MNQRELEQLEKKSIETIRLNNDMKDQVIQSYINNLHKKIKLEIKKKKIIVIVTEDI